MVVKGEVMVMEKVETKEIIRMVVLLLVKIEAMEIKMATTTTPTPTPPTRK